MDEIQKIPRPTRTIYTWEQKQEVVKQAYLLSNIRLTSELTGVPVETISAWKKQEWWKEFEDSLKRAAHIEVDTKLKGILDRGLDVIANRLEFGEQVLNNKTGTLVHKPVSLRDAATATNIVLTQKRAMQKDIEDRQERRDNMKDTLASLAAEFSKWNLRKNNNDAVDVIPTELEDVEQIDEE